jgi:hypothetical protein
MIITSKIVTVGSVTDAAHAKGWRSQIAKAGARGVYRSVAPDGSVGPWCFGVARSLLALHGL